MKIKNGEEDEKNIELVRSMYKDGKINIDSLSPESHSTFLEIVNEITEPYTTNTGLEYTVAKRNGQAGGSDGASERDLVSIKLLSTQIVKFIESNQPKFNGDMFLLNLQNDRVTFTTLIEKMLDIFKIDFLNGAFEDTYDTHFYENILSQLYSVYLVNPNNYGERNALDLEEDQVVFDKSNSQKLFINNKGGSFLLRDVFINVLKYLNLIGLSSIVDTSGYFADPTFKQKFVNMCKKLFSKKKGVVGSLFGNKTNKSSNSMFQLSNPFKKTNLFANAKKKLATFKKGVRNLRMDEEAFEKLETTLNTSTSTFKDVATKLKELGDSIANYPSNSRQFNVEGMHNELSEFVTNVYTTQKTVKSNILELKDDEILGEFNRIGTNLTNDQFNELTKRVSEIKSVTSTNTFTRDVSVHRMHVYEFKIWSIELQIKHTEMLIKILKSKENSNWSTAQVVEKETNALSALQLELNKLKETYTEYKNAYQEENKKNRLVFTELAHMLRKKQIPKNTRIEDYKNSINAELKEIFKKSNHSDGLKVKESFYATLDGISKKNTDDFNDQLKQFKENSSMIVTTLSSAIRGINGVIPKIRKSYNVEKQSDAEDGEVESSSSESTKPGKFARLFQATKKEQDPTGYVLTILQQLDSIYGRVKTSPPKNKDELDVYIGQINTMYDAFDTKLQHVVEIVEQLGLQTQSEIEKDVVVEQQNELKQLRTSIADAKAKFDELSTVLDIELHSEEKITCIVIATDLEILKLELELYGFDIDDKASSEKVESNEQINKLNEEIKEKQALKIQNQKRVQAFSQKKGFFAKFSFKREECQVVFKKLEKEFSNLKKSKADPIAKKEQLDAQMIEVQQQINIIFEKHSNDYNTFYNDTTSSAKNVMREMKESIGQIPNTLTIKPTVLYDIIEMVNQRSQQFAGRVMEGGGLVVVSVSDTDRAAFISLTFVVKCLTMWICYNLTKRGLIKTKNEEFIAILGVYNAMVLLFSTILTFETIDIMYTVMYLLIFDIVCILLSLNTNVNDTQLRKCDAEETCVEPKNTFTISWLFLSFGTIFF